MQVPTHVTGVLEHESGALTTVLMSFDVWAARLPRIEVHGTEGSLSVPDPNGFDGTVEIATATNRDWTEVPVAGGYAGAGRGVGVADMARAIRNGEPHRANGALAYHVLDVLESLLEAAAQDQPVDVASTVERPAAVPLGASPEVRLRPGPRRYPGVCCRHGSVDWHSKLGSAKPERVVRVLDERKLDVLRAIVEDYVATHEPVGSKTLVDRHNLGVSPATVRNDMAALEEEGYITQPHTSAGRIPTDAGYRLFVDKLSTVKSLSAAEKKAISSFLVGAVDLDDVVRRTVRLLAQITRQVAIVQYPSLSRSSVRHIEVVTMTPRRLLLVLITSTGRVEQRIVETHEDVDEQLIADLRSRLNTALTGQRLTEAATSLASVTETFAPADRSAGGRRS